MADGTLIFDTKLDTNGLTTGLSGVGGVAQKALGGAVTAVAALGTAVVGTGVAFTSAANDVATYGDDIDKMSQKMGFSAEAYQEWDAVMQHSGTSMETLKSSMKTLANAAETGNEAFGELGITEKDLQTLNQQELFEKTITGLQNVDDTTQRTYLAGKLLGKGATELGALLNTSAEDTQAMRDRVHELGGVMSDEGVKNSAAFKDSLQDMQTAFAGVKNSIMSEMLPSFTSVMDGLTGLVIGEKDAEKKITDGVQGIVDKIVQSMPTIVDGISKLAKAFLEAAPKLIKSLGEGIIQAIPSLLPTIGKVITEIVKELVNLLPQLLDVGLKVIVELAKGIAQSLPQLIPQVVDIMLEIVDTLINNVDMLVDAAIQIIIALANGLINALPRLIEKAPEIIIKFIEALARNYPKMMQCGIELIVQLASGLVQAIPQIISKIPQIITGMINAIRNFIPQMMMVGRNLIEGIGNGIVNATSWLIGKIRELCNNALGAIKDFFGIASPSKKFKWVGEMCVEGMEEGFEDMDSVADGVTASLNNISANASGGRVDIATNGGLSDAIKGVLEGMGVYMDGRSVGYITADYVDESFGRFAARRV